MGLNMVAGGAEWWRMVKPNVHNEGGDSDPRWNVDPDPDTKSTVNQIWSRFAASRSKFVGAVVKWVVDRPPAVLDIVVKHPSEEYADVVVPRALELLARDVLERQYGLEVEEVTIRARRRRSGDDDPSGAADAEPIGEGGASPGRESPGERPPRKRAV